MSNSQQASKNDDHEIKPTDSQRKLLELIANGCNQAQASEALGISYLTARNQMKNLRARLSVESLEQAVAVATKRGWIRVDDYPRIRQ